MANRVHGIVAARWSRAAQRNEQELVSLVTTRAGDSFSDVTGQSDSRLAQLAANVYLCEADVAPATATAINALPEVLVLASETYDDGTGVVSSGNFDSAPSAPQLINLRDALTARFPGLNEARLTRAGQAILRAGLTRRQIIGLLTDSFREL